MIAEQGATINVYIRSKQHLGPFSHSLHLGVEKPYLTSALCANVDDLIYSIAAMVDELLHHLLSR